MNPKSHVLTVTLRPLSMISYQGDNRKYRKFKDGKFKVQCLNEYTNEEGRRFICNFVQREDHFKENLKKGKLHECKFIPASNTLTLDKFIRQESYIDQGPISEDDIYTHLVVFIGKHNLSIECGASNDLYELMIKCIAYGILIENPKASNPIRDAQKNFKKISAEGVRKKLILTADILHRSLMQNYSKLPYVAIAIDEGTTKTKNLDFVLQNVLSDLTPCCVKIMEGGKAKDYVQSLNEGFNEIQRYSILIGSVICDGNRAQSKAFSQKWPHSIVNTTSDLWKKQILFIPCICHRIQNAFKKALNKDNKLKDLILYLHEISDKLRSLADEIHALCPRHITTRWISDYAIFEFIEKNKEKIEKKIGPIKEGLSDLGKILEIFKSLINIFEKDKTPLSAVFYYIERAHFSLTQLSAENPFASIFDESLMNYTIDSIDGGIWVFSYLLTPNGRADFYNRLKNQNNGIPETDFRDFFKIQKKKDCDALCEIETEIINEKLDLIHNFDNSQKTENKDFDEVDLRYYEHSTSMIQRAKDYLKSICDQFHVSKKTAVSQLNQYLEQNLFGDYECGENFSWFQIRSLDDWNFFGDIALRLSCSPCSEASCERTISAQRLILTSRRYNSQKRLLDSRLTLMRATNPK